ncbi:MAG: succinylglutamate desuccinylase/aspartoacylase family protein [Candidatus Paceibacteria bacterium]
MNNKQIPSHFTKISGSCGPNVVILGGVHGDEKIGLEILKRFYDLFELDIPIDTPEVRSYRRNISGSLYLGLGNPKAVQQDTRGVGDRDLNRCFIPKHLQNKDRYNHYDYQRARELTPLLSRTDYLFDLHSTSNPSQPFICFREDSEQHRRLYSLAPIENVLTDPSDPPVLSRPFDSSVLGTTDYFVDEFGGSSWADEEGGTAICYESGHFQDMSKVQEVFESLLRMLTEVGSINKRFLADKKVDPNLSYSQPSEVYRLILCKLAESVNFVYEDGMDQNWKQVEKGQTIGRYTDLNKEVTAPTDGTLLFPRNQSKIRYEGDSLFYLAERI